MTLPPDKQPTGGWVLRITETGGTVKADDFGKFVRAINEQLTSNGFAAITPETILERMQAACSK